MYSFTDTTAVPGSNDLPAEAMSINGQYIEQVIPGYRTLSVSGRESLEAELAMLESSCRDGGVYQRRRYLPRTIIVQYQLIASTPEVFMSLHTQLLSILSAEQAKIIFADEPDKYYIGTKTKIENVPPGQLAVIGDITIFCADPFKYSVEETEVSAENGAFAIDYTGTYPARPRLVATIGSEAGYVGYIDGDGHILQIGDPDEADGDVLNNSETLVNVNFASSASPSGWTKNNGVVNTTNTWAIEQKGAFSVQTKNGQKGISPSNVGTGNGWHGPSLTRKIPASSAGIVGAVNCKFSWTQYFAMTSDTGNKELGCQQFIMSDSQGRAVFAVDVRKNKQGTHMAKLQFYKLGEKVKESDFPVKPGSDVTGKNAKAGGQGSIEKLGATFKVTFYGKQYTYKDESLKDTAITAITVYSAASVQYPQVDSVIKNVKFIFHNVNTWREIKNKLAAGDVLEANCNDGTILVNGTDTPGLGALGNDWERFVLKPGTNQIQCLASEWAETAPEFKLYYRKVYL